MDLATRPTIVLGLFFHGNGLTLVLHHPPLETSANWVMSSSIVLAICVACIFCCKTCQTLLQEGGTNSKEE